VDPRTQEENALPIAGKKRNLNDKILIDYFAKERLKLNDTIISQVLNKINSEWNNWENVIKISFLSNDMKEKHLELMKGRKQIVGL
jgi:serine/threonine-protein kinase HipA